jgi:signal-transduction protein with cAMP-binding, CBS, and nucleotidyltransferase domain
VVTPKLKVADVMSGEVVVVRADEKAKKAAMLMGKHGIGCVIVVDSRDKPIGIITARDFMSRVVAKGLNADEVTCREVMTTPLMTIEPQAPLAVAISKMAKNRVGRLIVMDRGKLIGIITEKDVLKVAPALIEVSTSRGEVEESYVREIQAGYCEVCGEWSDDLREVNGHFLCEECRGEYSTFE